MPPAETRRRQRDEPFVDFGAEFGHDAKGCVVRDEPADVSEDRTGDAEETHSGYGDPQCDHRRHLRGPSDEPRSGSLQANASADCRSASQDAKGSAIGRRTTGVDEPGNGPVVAIGPGDHVEAVARVNPAG